MLDRFNYYRIVEKPHLESGHTFSMTADSPRYRIELIMDDRYPEGPTFP